MKHRRFAVFEPVRILAVMVRYQTPLAESPTMRGLTEAFGSDPRLHDAFSVAVWDNSPETRASAELPANFVYRAARANLGPSGAFNKASEFARLNGYRWMLLLDQDTAVTAPFLRGMLRHARVVDGRIEIAAIAPTVRVRGMVVSPRRQLFNRHRAYPAGETGIAPGEPFAVNSGCLIRVSALRQIGGFSTDFWLDYSDLYVFHQFWLHGLKVWRAADVELEHDMSIMDYERLMSPQRYRNYSAAESAFNDLYKGRLENAVQDLRLLARAIKQRHKYTNPEFSRIAWRQLLYRLRTPRPVRLERWRAESNTRIAQATLPDDRTASHDAA